MANSKHVKYLFLRPRSLLNGLRAFRSKSQLLYTRTSRMSSLFAECLGLLMMRCAGVQPSWVCLLIKASLFSSISTQWTWPELYAAKMCIYHFHICHDWVNLQVIPHSKRSKSRFSTWWPWPLTYINNLDLELIQDIISVPPTRFLVRMSKVQTNRWSQLATDTGGKEGPCVSIPL